MYSQILVATGEDSKITISMEDLNTLISTKVQEEMSKTKVKSGVVDIKLITSGTRKKFEVHFDNPFETLNYSIAFR